jgi:hypothetical protein
VDVSGDLGAYWRKVARAQDFHVRAMVNQQRDTAMLFAKRSISRNGGDIVDFRTFSKLTLSMVVQVERGRLPSLVDSLVALGWDVDVDRDPEALAERASENLAGTFHLSFR